MIFEHQEEDIVTGIFGFFMDTDKWGNPQPNCQLTKGSYPSYIARTTSSPKFKSSAGQDMEMKDGRFVESSGPTEGTATFS
jgi:hypothetical protein